MRISGSNRKFSRHTFQAMLAIVAAGAPALAEAQALVSPETPKEVCQLTIAQAKAEYGDAWDQAWKGSALTHYRAALERFVQILGSEGAQFIYAYQDGRFGEKFIKGYLSEKAAMLPSGGTASDGREFTLAHELKSTPAGVVLEVTYTAPLDESSARTTRGPEQETFVLPLMRFLPTQDGVKKRIDLELARRASKALKIRGGIARNAEEYVRMRPDIPEDCYWKQLAAQAQSEESESQVALAGPTLPVPPPSDGDASAGI